MPDVPERCAECGAVIQHPGNQKWMPLERTGVQHDRERCLEVQLATSRAEVERYRQQYEALRERLTLLADQFGEAAEAAWRTWEEYGDTAAQHRFGAWEYAGKKVREILALPEAGDGEHFRGWR